MKKILALLLTAIMLLSLAACNGGKSDEKTKDKPEPGKVDVNPSPDENKKQPDTVLTYDFSNPEEDLENSPGYQYFIQTVPTEETDLTKIAAAELNDNYYANIKTAINAITEFKTAEVLQEKLNQSIQLTDKNGNIIDAPEEDNQIIYAQTPDYIHEIDAAIYPQEGYTYLTYGTMQDIENIATWQTDFDMAKIPELMRKATGLTITKKDIETMMKNIQELQTRIPDQPIYMVSVTDPETFSAVQTALLYHNEKTTIGITGSRYIDMANNEN